MNGRAPKRIDFSKPIFVIEHCNDFNNQRTSTHINPHKYAHYAKNMANAIREHVPSAVILFNQVPKAWYQSNLYC